MTEYRWRCRSCGEWHTELPLDLAYDEPDTFHNLSPEEKTASFFTKDVCVTREPQHHFVRGIIALPIIELHQDFCFGVWSSLSEQNFKYLMDHWDDPDIESWGPKFGWLNNQIEGYPDTFNLKVNVHFKRDTRPFFELEPTDHPLAVEQRSGMPLSRVQDLAVRFRHQ